MVRGPQRRGDRHRTLPDGRGLWVNYLIALDHLAADGAILAVLDRLRKLFELRSGPLRMALTADPDLANLRQRFHDVLRPLLKEDIR